MQALRAAERYFGRHALTIALLSVPPEHLAVLAAGRTPSGVTATVDALPPKFVPQRTLDQVAQGKLPTWCCLFYIIHPGTVEVLGTCGFKDEARDGKVEVGYGVAPEYQGNGYATEALAPSWTRTGNTSSNGGRAVTPSPSRKFVPFGRWDAPAASPFASFRPLWRKANSRSQPKAAPASPLPCSSKSPAVQQVLMNFGKPTTRFRMQWPMSFL